MIGRIVEVADDGRHLSCHRGLLLVQESDAQGQELGQVPLDDIAALIGNARALTYSNSLLAALAERGIPFVICGTNHAPVGMLLPVEGHHQQAHRIDAQLAATRPTCKRLWASIVRAKLRQQAATLEAVGVSNSRLFALADRVRSGDPDNVEAQGARHYWPLLFGKAFRRDQSAAGVNSLLNYGYTVVRAATARAVLAAGLHPSVSLHHSNDQNPMRLVDDVMEPFRPLIDLRVWRLLHRGEAEVTRLSKRDLVLALFDDLETAAGRTPVFVCIQRLATSLAQVYVGERDVLELPQPGAPVPRTASADDP